MYEAQELFLYVINAHVIEAVKLVHKGLKLRKGQIGLLLCMVQIEKLDVSIWPHITDTGTDLETLLLKLMR